MTRAYEKQVMNLVKNRARILGISQKKVAQQLAVSIPTVKRWWAGQGVKLGVISQLCGFLGLSLSQLFLELEGGVLAYSYTLEQEKMLAANPRCLALFDLLVSGESLSSIKRVYHLSENDLSSLLLKLDRGGLIELHPKNKVKLKHHGEPLWIADGPLTALYRTKMIEALLQDHAKPHSTFFIHSYLPEDHTLLQGKIKELENLMRTCNSRGVLNPERTKSYGAYLCLKPFTWSLRDKLLSR